MKVSAFVQNSSLGMSPIQKALQSGAVSSITKPFPNSFPNCNTDGRHTASRSGVLGMGERQSQPLKGSDRAWLYHGLCICYPLPTWGYTHSWSILSTFSGKSPDFFLAVRHCFSDHGTRYNSRLTLPCFVPSRQVSFSESSSTDESADSEMH